jgi:hypothetical protein
MNFGFMMRPKKVRRTPIAGREVMTKLLGMVLGVALLLLPMGVQAEEALVGKKIYEIDLDITGTTDYGVTMDAIMSGKAKVPLQGAQFDVAFVGTSKSVLAGKVHGVDYLVMRADGRTDLNVHATLETEDGQRIAAHIGGVASPRQNEPIIDLHENIRLITASEKYSWVNSRQVWGVGTVNVATGKAHIEAYMQQ